MNEELKPCPFCGGNDLEIRPIFSEDMPDFEFAKAVTCLDCCTTGRHHHPIGWSESDREAIEAWNARHTPEGYVMVPVELVNRAASSNMQRSINWRIGVINEFARIAAAQDPDK